jgi:hypothetical protein
MRERDARAQPFLSGMFTRGEVVSAGSRGESAHEREPIAIFTCEVLPLYATDLDDDTARIICAATVRRRSFSLPSAHWENALRWIWWLAASVSGACPVASTTKAIGWVRPLPSSCSSGI